ncbi:MAG: hypothetical protein QME07_02000 [bacterium]|nr:hypothetical protein [bacterium]
MKRASRCDQVGASISEANGRPEVPPKPVPPILVRTVYEERDRIID